MVADGGALNLLETHVHHSDQASSEGGLDDESDVFQVYCFAVNQVVGCFGGVLDSTSVDSEQGCGLVGEIRIEGGSGKYVACLLEVCLDEEVVVLENLLLWEGIEEANQIIIDVCVVCGGIVLSVRWQFGEEAVELLECDGHRGKAHCILPHCFDDLVDDHSCGFE